MSNILDWDQLLSTKRIKNLMDPSQYSNREIDSGEEHEFDDPRSEYLRDFDRVIFSAPFRRMQDKAQVFPMDPNDSVRTRLTHSLEVSGVARGLAASATRWLVKNDKLSDSGKLKSNEKREAIIAIAATCGLIHDLGNPPFGHAGEQAIQEWFQNGVGKQALSPLARIDRDAAQDFLHFEGNAQTIRLTSRLQILYHEFGLNLTCATQSAMLKYTSSSHKAGREDVGHSNSKPGYFSSEKALVEKLRTEIGTGNARNPITYLVEAADDIVYSVADIEDGVKKGVICWKDIIECLEIGDAFTKKCLEDVESQVPDSELPPNLEEAKVQFLRVYSINYYVPTIVRTWVANYTEIMDGSFNDELYKLTDACKFVNSLKTLARKKVYTSSQILKLELLGREVIHSLMNIFWEGVKSLELPEKDRSTFSKKIVGLMSDNYLMAHCAACESGLNSRYCGLQLLTDYVSGMTDTFATSLYNHIKHG